MSSTENIDRTIERMIEKDAKNFERVFTTPEEKDAIVARIAALRSAMNPPCNCDKKD